jgi:MerR family redox-sensitive transcriptional activator SoxR
VTNGTRGARRTLSIGEVAERTGLTVSAIRFYEARGLVTPARNAGGQRRFRPADLRRLAFVTVAQRLGITLAEIRQRLDALPDGRAPTQRDWARMSREFRATLDERIELATRLRDRLDGCIGCGCLSLGRCALYNPADRAAERGPGPRWLLEDP